MEMRKKGSSNAQDRIDSSLGARPAHRVYHVLSDTVYRALAYPYSYSACPDLGRASVYVAATGIGC